MLPHCPAANLAMVVEVSRGAHELMLDITWDICWRDLGIAMEVLRNIDDQGVECTVIQPQTLPLLTCLPT